MKILIIDASVLAYKSFMRLFSQDYSGDTNDEIHEFTSQYISELLYLNELHQPDGILWAMDCPREDVWRHKVIRRFYGPLVKAHAVAWIPGTENPTTENACRWHVECHDSYKTVWLNADGSFSSKQMNKKAYTDWAKSVAEEGAVPKPSTDRAFIKRMLPVVAKMYKGTRQGKHWPSTAMPKESFKEISTALAYKLAPLFNGRVVYADELEADDLAYAAVVKWPQHDITVATIDMDWLQLKLHHERQQGPIGKFQFWDLNKYEMVDTETPTVRRSLIRKLLEGDSSDNISSVRLKGSTAGIGPKKADKIFDEVPAEKMYEWLKENADPATLMRNVDLMNLSRIPEDLGARARCALRDSDSLVKTPPDYRLEDLVSESAINMAKINGQKARQMLLIKGGTA